MAIYLRGPISKRSQISGKLKIYLKESLKVSMEAARDVRQGSSIVLKGH
jgi:hypothetical protein